MQAITEKGGEGIAGKGREEDERGDGVGQAIICFDLEELLVSILRLIDCLIDCLHKVSVHRRSRRSCQKQ